jgi:hypothetical protein
VDTKPTVFVEGNASKAPVPTLRFRFPDANKDTVIQAVPGVDSPYRTPNGFLTFKPQPPADLALENIYIGTSQFVQQIRRTGLPMRLEGWKNPFLHIGKTKLQLGNETQPFIPSSLFARLALGAMFAPTSSWQSWGTLSLVSSFAVRVDAPAGTVYGIGTPYGSDGIQLHLSLGRVSNEGILYFTAPHAVLEFAQSQEELYQDWLKIAELGYGSFSRPAKALLVRLENDLQTKTIEVPANKRTVAIK